MTPIDARGRRLLARLGMRSPPHDQPEPVRWRHSLWPARSIEQFVVSFPKSGRTWLRVLMAVAEAAARGDEPERVVEEWLSVEAPRLNGTPTLFTHALAAPAREPTFAIELFLRYIGDRRRLFLVRDPRDVVVSAYFQETKRSRKPTLPENSSLGTFVRDPGLGIERILAFNRACDESLRSDPGPTLVLSYEDLHREPTRGLRAALNFFGAPSPSEALILSAVDFGRFENMRRYEHEHALILRNRRLRARNVDDPESFKTRRGVVGGYVDYLSADELDYVEERIAALQPPVLGYLEPGAPPAATAIPQRASL